jgi:aspartate/methionine/tyrosine aminotransferase
VISAASNVDDVDQDDTLIIDGMTKRFRLPGWRLAWIVGPKAFIKALGSCGSYLDGGPNVPFQLASVPMLEPTKVREEMKALQTHFMAKRDYVVSSLREMGFKISYVPESTFYLWYAIGRDLTHILTFANRLQARLEQLTGSNKRWIEFLCGTPKGEGHCGSRHFLRPQS